MKLLFNFQEVNFFTNIWAHFSTVNTLNCVLIRLNFQLDADALNCFDLSTNEYCFILTWNKTEFEFSFNCNKHWPQYYRIVENEQQITNEQIKQKKSNLFIYLFVFSIYLYIDVYKYIRKQWMIQNRGKKLVQNSWQQCLSDALSTRDTQICCIYIEILFSLCFFLFLSQLNSFSFCSTGKSVSLCVW